MLRRLFALPVVFLLACSSSTPAEPASDADPSPLTCASYDGPPSEGHLPYEGSSATGPTCRPRCGANEAFDNFYSASALPTGSCEGSVTCDMAAVPKCGCAEDRGPVNGYRCACESGTWRCWIVSQGGSICRDSCPDAGETADATE